MSAWAFDHLGVEPVAPPQTDDAARAFLSRYGHTSLVSLGCGSELNRLDNHLRLLIALDLDYYVGIDCVPAITVWGPHLFMDDEDMLALLHQYYWGEFHKFRDAVKVFPNTWVEELAGIHCAVVVCQRVWPHCRWEEIILSMTPKLVLQEDSMAANASSCGAGATCAPGPKFAATISNPFGPGPFSPGNAILSSGGGGISATRRCKTAAGVGSGVSAKGLSAELNYRPITMRPRRLPLYANRLG